MFDVDALGKESSFWPAAHFLAMASKLAYGPRDAIGSIVIAGWGFSRCEFFEAEFTQGFMASTPDVTLVAFCGIKSVGDWLGNLDIEKLPDSADEDSGGRRGYDTFYQEFKQVRQRVEAFVKGRLWLTGHSRGGAVAAVAGAELERLASRVHTFGQPSFGNDRIARYLNERLSDRFFRFVNNGDLVTRVPLGTRHAGRVIHFDAQGNVRQSSPETEATTLERPPLTVEQFQKVQSEIHEVNAALKAADTSDRIARFDASIQGLLPGMSDHKINRYIAAIRRQFGDASVEAMPTASLVRLSSALESAGDAPLVSVPLTYAPVLIRLRDSTWKAPAGLKVNSQIGTIVSAQATKEAIEALKKDAGVASVEFSRDAGQYELAASVPFVSGDVVRKPPIGEDGDAAIVGIIDTGVDVLHEAFRDAAGKTRILAIWNQRDTSGRTPKAIDPAGFTQDYGTVYLAADIDQFISRAATPPAALRDPAAHGTHVASIAAGRGGGAGGLADGMAPAARLLVVIPHMRTKPGDPPSLGYSSSHADALDFLKSAAGGGTPLLDQPHPIAVNVSLGMNAGAHDGSSALEAAFDQVTNSGRDPGYVIVKSAGNERSHHGHVRTRVGLGLITIAWNTVQATRVQDYIEVWYDFLDELEFRLLDPAGNSSAVVSRNNPSFKQVLGASSCEMKLTALHPDNGDSLLRITLVSGATPIANGTWTLQVTGKQIHSPNGFIDAWVERDDGRAVSFVNSDDTMTLSIPGTAQTVITVGACHSQDPMQLTSTSSYGLTRDGRAKPDLCAPGADIIAAKAGTRNGVATMTGTSMAAPMVTGALALALSRRHKQGQPQWNAQQLRAALIRSTRNFNRVHHEGFGYGVLHVKQLFDNLP